MARLWGKAREFLRQSEYAEGPGTTGASQGCGVRSEGVEAVRVCGPGGGARWPGACCSSLWVCAPSSLVTFTPVLFFKMEGSLGLDPPIGFVTLSCLDTRAALFSLYVGLRLDHLCALLRFSFLPLGLRRRRHI